jgi:branched-chain amino acid transport system permease protein
MVGAFRSRAAPALAPASMHVIPQLIVSTLLLGGVYALIAVGLTLIFGVMRVVNFAHGEFLMLGMYLGFWAFALLGFDPYLTLIVSLPLSLAVGWVSYRAVMGPVVHASHNVQVFTTVGLSIALQNVALVLWSADARFVRTEYYAVVVRVGGAAFNVAQIVAFGVAVALTAGLFAFMRWSYTGKVMRATAQDRQASALMGIDTDRVYGITLAVGIACVGAAGVLLAPIYPVYPTAGLQFVLIAFVAVVLGGLGDMAGAVIAALVVAAVEVAGSYVIGTAWKEVLYLVLFIAILVVRPAGLFGQRGAEAIGT